MKFLVFSLTFGAFFLLRCSSNDNPSQSIPPEMPPEIQTGNITGKVTVDSTGEPLSGVSIITVPSSSKIVSDTSGNYAILNVPIGEYEISAFKNNFYRIRVNISVEGGRTINVDFPLKKSSPVPVEGLIAYYPLNNSANDQSGNANHGIFYGAKPSMDRFGTNYESLSFDGLDDSLFVSSNNFSKITSEITISMWIKVTENQKTLLILSNSQGHSGNLHTYDLKWHGSSRLGFGVYKQSGGIVCYTKESLADNKWHHIVGLKRGTGIQIYVDGVYNDRTSGPDYKLRDLKYLYLGFWHGFYGEEYLKAGIDDIRIYERKLKVQEIEALYHERDW